MKVELDYSRTSIFIFFFILHFFTDPDFVSSHEIDDFVYFFFRETAVEYINCGKVSHRPAFLRARLT